MENKVFNTSTGEVRRYIASRYAPEILSGDMNKVRSFLASEIERQIHLGDERPLEIPEEFGVGKGKFLVITDYDGSVSANLYNEVDTLPMLCISFNPNPTLGFNDVHASSTSILYCSHGVFAPQEPDTRFFFRGATDYGFMNTNAKLCFWLMIEDAFIESVLSGDLRSETQLEPSSTTYMERAAELEGTLEF